MDTRKYYTETEKLKEEFSDLIPKTRTEATVGNGWVPLVRSCLEELRATGIEIKVTQIKEKFGELRIYYSAKDRGDLDRIISKYEALASTTCEFCGKPGELKYVNWYKTLCQEHEEEMK